MRKRDVYAYLEAVYASTTTTIRTVLTVIKTNLKINLKATSFTPLLKTQNLTLLLAVYYNDNANDLQQIISALRLLSRVTLKYEGRKCVDTTKQEHKRDTYTAENDALTSALYGNVIHDLGSDREGKRASQTRQEYLGFSPRRFGVWDLARET